MIFRPGILVQWMDFIGKIYNVNNIEMLLASDSNAELMKKLQVTNFPSLALMRNSQLEVLRVPC